MTSGSAGRIEAGVNLPEMPASLKIRCSDPGVRDGKDARIELARNRKALATCRRKHAGTVKFYDEVKKEFGT